MVLATMACVVVLMGENAASIFKCSVHSNTTPNFIYTVSNSQLLKEQMSNLIDF